MKLIILAFVLTSLFFSQEKSSVKIEDGYLIIKIKLNTIDLDNFDLDETISGIKSSSKYKKEKERQNHYDNIFELTNIFEIYEMMLLNDDRDLDKDMKDTYNTLKILKIVNKINSKEDSSIRKIKSNSISYTFNKVSKINDHRISYTFGKISKIGDTRISYTFDKVSKVGDIRISYTFDKLSKIGEYRVNAP